MKRFLGKALLFTLISASAFPQTGERLVELSIVDGKVASAQKLIKVNKGDQLRLRVTSDKPGDIHLHAYRIQAKLTSGQASEIAMQAYATGKFRFEWHEAARKDKSNHHAEPLAVLEVRPR